MGARRPQRKGLRLVEAAGRPSWQTPPITRTVLIVDDEDGIRDFLRSAFEGEGFTVLAAADGEAALALCQLYRPDAILLDLMMPRLDGLGFLHEYRRRYGVETTPIYIMSAVSTAIEHAQDAGVAGAFVKPFDLDEVLSTIDGAVQANAQAAKTTGNWWSHNGRMRA
jgi:two-component system, OmpR family, response regulator MprA